jgi:serine protease Do
MKRLCVSLVIAALVAFGCTAEPRSSTTTNAPVSPAGVGLGQSERPRNAIVAVVKRVLPAVVNVTTDQLQTDPLTGEGQGVGTGFIVSSDGYVVTNFHVVEQAQRIRVTTSGPNPDAYDARVVGGDQTADVAVLKVDATGLPTLPIGSSDGLQLGQRVVAIGYALALEGGPSVTAGIVSSLTRTIRAEDPNCDECNPPGIRTYSNIVQTDAAINPGNSGGPLVDLRGRVVGINSAGAGGAENIGFAISIDFAWPIIQDAVESPDAPVAYLGVTSSPVDETLAIQIGLEIQAGAYVVGVSPNGPAERAGIESGDVIITFDGEPVQGPNDLGALIRAREPGDQVDVGLVTSGGTSRTVTATLDVNPLP